MHIGVRWKWQRDRLRHLRDCLQRGRRFPQHFVPLGFLKEDRKNQLHRISIKHFLCNGIKDYGIV